MKHIETNTVTILVVVTLILVFLESFLFENGNAIFALFGLIGLLFSLKKKRRFIFWLSILFLIIAILSLWSLRIVVFCTLLYILYKLYKKQPIEISTQLDNKQSIPSNRTKNRLFLFEQLDSETYRWEDLNMQNFVGDIVINTTQTILPKGTSTIMIRQGFGKTTIIVPFAIPVRIHYTTLVGEAKLFQTTYPRLWNEALTVRDSFPENQLPNQQLIIHVASFFGDVEVIRK